MDNDRDFLRAILSDPEDETLRLIYADWLEEQGDPRAEFLRLEAQVAQLPSIPKDQPRKIARALRAQIRLEDLAYRIDPDWHAILDRTRCRFSARWARPIIDSNWRANLDQTSIEDCDILFRFKCAKKWQSLRTTDNAGVRYCDSCRKNVYYCSSVEEARDHAGRGHCVAQRPWWRLW